MSVHRLPPAPFTTRHRDARDALARADALVVELERRIAADPFRGLDRRAAHATSDELYELKRRVRAELAPIDRDQRDGRDGRGDDGVRALEARLVAADRAADVSAAAWARAMRETEIRDGWARIQRDVAGWRDEQMSGLAAAAQRFDPPALPRTQTAVARIGSLLADPRSTRIREDNQGAAPIEAIFREAEDALEVALARLHAAFGAVLDDAEAAPPASLAELDRLRRLAAWAEQAFAGTRHLARNRARAQALAALVSRRAGG